MTTLKRKYSNSQSEIEDSDSSYTGSFNNFRDNHPKKSRKGVTYKVTTNKEREKLISLVYNEKKSIRSVYFRLRFSTIIGSKTSWNEI